MSCGKRIECQGYSGREHSDFYVLNSGCAPIGQCTIIVHIQPLHTLKRNICHDANFAVTGGTEVVVICVASDNNVCMTTTLGFQCNTLLSLDVIKQHHEDIFASWWRHQMETFSALLTLCEGNSPVNSPPKSKWRGASMFSLICAWENLWVNIRDAGDLRRHRAYYDITVMDIPSFWLWEGEKS